MFHQNLTESYSQELIYNHFLWAVLAVMASESAF